ncbi:MAG TPA: 1-(5-phosphoribosyl)-5-[(5-phosphoribosylamino)methylideneamino]imidazole-4-carboxamide isomerase [Dehalococcoidia bacterium]
MTFEVIPAIDLRGGRCVRLYQGDYDRETVYSADPAEMARHWQSLGAGRLHVVDLDGARSGEQANAAAARAILGAVSIPVQLGGGVRDLETVARWLDAGVDRVFLGTAAATDAALLREACARFPGRVAAGADARGGRIAVRGWEEDTGESVADFARRALAAGVCALSYTNISLDGTFEGPDVAGVRRLIEEVGPTAAQIILAGGVGSLEHVRAAAAVPGLGGVIVGRALYEGRVDLKEAIAAASGAAG